MVETWAPAVTPFVVAVLLLVVPGLVVVWAGWGLRRLGPVLIAPAISASLIAGSAVVAPWVGMRWSLLPPAILTIAVAITAFLIRRRVRDARPLTSARTFFLALAAGVAAGALLLWQFVPAFVSPESIAQRFDVIVHLNSVEYILQTANASAFHIGDTSDIGFYPNGWHALASLTATLTGADVPTAVNVANLAIVALLWPASNMALASALFGERAAAYVPAAALSTGFGAFPALFFDWGVLYPNALGYSMLPAVLAAGVRLFTAEGVAGRLRDTLLGVLLAAGTTLAHPNAFLGAALFGTLLCVGLSAASSREETVRHRMIRTGAIGVSGALLCMALWMFARTSAEHSPWPPYQFVPQAIGGGLVVSPQGHAPDLLVLVLLVAGFVAAARRPRLVPVLLPYAAAVALYVLASGFPIDHPLRVALTNPWYSDPQRFAGLLPLSAIPVLTAGAIFLNDAAHARLAGAHLRGSTRNVARIAVTAIGFVALFSVAVSPVVRGPLHGVAVAYTDSADYAIVSTAERRLLDRLDDTVPTDALIIGSPRTGTSLAYALAGRQVAQKHIFGSPDDDVVFLSAHLRDIETDPAVCAAVDRVGADYVLDFGSFDVSGDADPREYAGIVDLSPSAKLVLVDEEGDAARLFRITGC